MMWPVHCRYERRALTWVTALFVCTGRITAQRPDEGLVEFSERERVILSQMSPLGPVPRDPTNTVADDPRAARLGQFIFFDPRFSADGKVSCSTCHDPAHSLADGKSIGEGIGKGVRHTPSLWNVAYNRWFFWDGRADRLWSQATQPFETPAEMGGSRLEVVHTVAGDPELRRAYEAIFGDLPAMNDASPFPAKGRPVPERADDPLNTAWTSMREEDQVAVTRVLVNMGKSVAAYERRLVSDDSPFDRFVVALLRGDEAGIRAYPIAAQRGLKMFIGEGNCRLCHSGPNLTDGEFHDTRVRTPDGGPPRDPGRFVGAERVLQFPFNARSAYSDDRGCDAAAQLEFLANGPQNWGLFKTPSLRNVALTAPYMHLGQLAALEDVMEHYSRLPGASDSHHPERILVRLNLTSGQIDDLVAFLESLTGAVLDESLLRKPVSP